jgi:hypothetical protein
METDRHPGARATGACLCGSVRYEIRGELRDVLFCHCEKCRRTHGHLSAYASTRREDLVLLSETGLTWYRSVTDETPNVHRGFCRVCGSSVFWDPRGQANVSISAGTLHQPTGVKAVGHVWLSQAGDYYEIDDDLPKAEGSSHGEFLAADR